MQDPLDPLYMRRAMDLAWNGITEVAPNPVVGAVVVHQGKVIGEGWHERYGQSHAEINALNQVSQQDQDSLKQSTLYVSLEPCKTTGNTPPCCERIYQERLPTVVYAMKDLSPAMTSIIQDRYSEHGIQIVQKFEAEEAERITAMHHCFRLLKRPFITLKFAQSKDGFLGKVNERTQLSNPFSMRFAHKLRAQHQAILVGTQTALVDNPSLDCRYWPGKDALRIIPDRSGRLSSNLTILNSGRTLLVTSGENVIQYPAHIEILKVKEWNNWLQELCTYLYNQKIQTLLVEGGAKLINTLIQKNLWDLSYTVTTAQILQEGTPAPKVPKLNARTFHFNEDLVVESRNSTLKSY